MISYQHADLNICEQIYSQLTSQHNFCIWFDQTNMYGSVMDRMAEGIEKSEIVLICMSEGYKKSRNCRSEATYAHKIKRCIIPLKLHRDFKAAGWLGITVGDLLYVDFSEKQPFDVAYKKLIEQIGRYRQPEEPGMFRMFKLLQ